MIVDKQLVVSNRKKVDIVGDLRQHKFRPFPKVVTSKATEETEEAAEEENDGGPVSDSDFDYLLSMPIWSLTKEKIEKLRQQAAEKERELLSLLEKSPKDMWKTDLGQFLKAWEVRVQHYWRTYKNTDTKFLGRLCRICVRCRS